MMRTRTRAKELNQSSTAGSVGSNNSAPVTSTVSSGQTSTSGISRALTALATQQQSQSSKSGQKRSRMI